MDINFIGYTYKADVELEKSMLVNVLKDLENVSDSQLGVSHQQQEASPNVPNQKSGAVNAYGSSSYRGGGDMSKSSSDNNLGSGKNQTTTRDSSNNKKPPQQLMINLHGQEDFHIVTQNNFTPASPSAAYYNQQIIQMNPGQVKPSPRVGTALAQQKPSPLRKDGGGPPTSNSTMKFTNVMGSSKGFQQKEHQPPKGGVQSQQANYLKQNINVGNKKAGTGTNSNNAT